MKQKETFSADSSHVVIDCQQLQWPCRICALVNEGRIVQGGAGRERKRWWLRQPITILLADRYSMREEATVVGEGERNAQVN